LAAPIIQFQLNGYNGLVLENKANAEEALTHDLYYMLKAMGCKDSKVEFSTVDCGKGVYQNVRLEQALRSEDENSKEVKSLNSWFFNVILVSGYILFLGFYLEYRREYKRYIEKERRQKTNDAIQKEVNDWLEIASNYNDVKVRFKKC